MNNDLLTILQSHKCLCWYPSAGSDFRALLYLSRPFYEKHSELSGTNAGLPDLFIMTDYQASAFHDYGEPDRTILTDSQASEVFSTYGVTAFRRQNFEALRSGKLTVGTVLFKDEYTTFTVKRCERIFAPDLGIQRELIDPDWDEISEWYGKGYFMTLAVDSHRTAAKKLGKWEVGVLYLYAENTAFARDILVQNHINVDYIVRIRYGGGCGGGSVGTDGRWLFRLSELLHVKCYISDKRGEEKEGDFQALKYILGDGEIQPERAALVPLYDRSWYKGEAVVWYQVKK